MSLSGHEVRPDPMRSLKFAHIGEASCRFAVRDEALCELVLH
jgi:hypothetical protein